MSLGKSIGLLSFVIALIILWKIRQVVLLAFSAIVFATVINKLVQKLQKVNIKRGIAVPISVLLVLLIIGAITTFIVTSLSAKWEIFVDIVPKIVEKLPEWYEQIKNIIPDKFIQDLDGLQDVVRQMLSSSQWYSGFFVVFSNSLDFVVNFLLVTVVTIMLLVNPSAYRKVFIILFPAFYRSRIDEVLDDCERALCGWFIGIVFNMSAIALMSGIGLLILGIPLPWVNACIAGILTFIPNIGPTLSVIPPTLLGLSQAPWKGIATVILYIAIQQLESNILTPLVMKRQVYLLPAITLLSQVSFAIFFGIFGLFLALPIVVVLQVILKNILVEDILSQWKRNH